MAARILAVMVVALALLGGGYWWGHTATDNAWQARQTKASQEQAQALDEERQRADDAGTAALQEHLDQEARYAQLDEEHRQLLRRFALTVPARSTAPTPASERVASTGLESAPAPVALERAEPELSLAAVRLWNGALHGRDQAAGACGVAGAPGGADAACAQGSGLTLDDAWANHRTNAMSCAADRLRLNQLIDYLSED